MTNLEYANSLRQVADFIESHPDFPQPHHTISVHAWGGKGPFLSAVVLLKDGGTVQKTADDPEKTWPRYHAKRLFGGITLDIGIDRSEICKLVRPAQYDCPDSLMEEYVEGVEPYLIPRLARVTIELLPEDPLPASAGQTKKEGGPDA
jgi:hypothetical protein